MRQLPLSCGMVVLATAVAAHSGVQNPAVKARMDAMERIANEMKTIGLMAQGQTAFDAEAARAAAAVPALFAAPEDDTKSEARATIWDDFSHFTALNRDMDRIARDLSQNIATQADAVAALAALGQTCRACHTAYRE